MQKQPSNAALIRDAIGLAILVGLFWFALTLVPNPTKDSVRKEQIQQGFSGWDRSHIELEKIIKKTMYNPRSYEHVETKCYDKQDYLMVVTTFRGTNAFGGVVTQTVSAKCSIDGRVLDITKGD